MCLKTNLFCGSNSDIDPIFSCNTELNLIYMQKKGLGFLLCLCNLNYLVVSCNLVPLQLLNKLHFVLNYCGEMAGHDRIKKKPAAAAMKYVAISYCSIYDEKKEGKEIISLSKNNNLTSLTNGFLLL